MRRVREKRRAAEARGEYRITSGQAKFVAELCRNGGNVSAACRVLGYSASTGYAWLDKPSVAALYTSWLEEVGHRVQDWGTLLGRAQATLLSLLDSSDEKVRKDVAIYLTERAIGKVPTKIDATIREERALSEVELQAALSLVAEHRMTLQEASRYVRGHPEEVAEWARLQTLAAAEDQGAARLAPGEPIDPEASREQGSG